MVEINKKSRIMNFESFYWHDAIIKNIVINRNSPGIKDEIEMEIIFPDNNERVNFVFEGVYWVKMELNFGIIADESILQSCLLKRDDKDLINLCSLWKDNVSNAELNVYEILLNSMGGKIKIIARKFKIDKL